MIYGLASACLFGIVDVAWWKLLRGESIWHALFWRSLSSSTILIGLLFWSMGYQFHVEWGDWHVLLLPALSGVLGLVFFSVALQLAPAQLVVPIINLTGLVVWIWSWGLADGDEMMGGLRWGAFVMAGFGVLTWLVPAWWHGEGGVREGMGGLFALLAVFIWGRGYVEYPKAMECVSPFVLAASVEVTMCLTGGLIALFTGATMLAPKYTHAMVIGVGVAGAVAFLTLAYAHLPTAMVGLLSTLTPVVVVLLTSIWIKTPFRRRDMVAIGSLLTANALQVLADF